MTFSKPTKKLALLKNGMGQFTPPNTRQRKLRISLIQETYYQSDTRNLLSV